MIFINSKQNFIGLLKELENLAITILLLFYHHLKNGYLASSSQEIFYINIKQAFKLIGFTHETIHRIH